MPQMLDDLASSRSIEGQEKRDLLERICGKGSSERSHLARGRPEVVSSSLCLSNTLSGEDSGFDIWSTTSKAVLGILSHE